MPESEVAVYSVKITPPTAILADISKQMLSSPKLMTTAYKRNTGRLKSRWMTALRVEPPPAANFYPLRWRSPKQRRAFFASKGFGGGIPHVRTHALSRGWKITILSVDKGGEITVENRSPIAGFVVGEFRQPMFNPLAGGISWLDPDEINLQFAGQAELILEATWLTVSDPHSAVR